MGYRIVYDGRPEESCDKAGNRFLLTAFWFCVFLLLVCAVWPEGRTLLRCIFIPGDPERTAQAASMLLEQLRNGVAMDEAVTAFCRTVIGYGIGH